MWQCPICHTWPKLKGKCLRIKWAKQSCCHPILYFIQFSQAKAKPGFPYHRVIIFHTPCARVWGPFVSLLYWTPSKCCPILSAFAFHIRHPPSTTPTLLLGCFLHLYSANTIRLHDQQHRGKGCKSTSRSLLLDISQHDCLNIWDSLEQTQFCSGGPRHDIKRHIHTLCVGKAGEKRGNLFLLVGKWHYTDRRGFKTTKWWNLFAFPLKCYSVSNSRVQHELGGYCWKLKSQLCSFYPWPVMTGSWPWLGHRKRIHLWNLFINVPVSFFKFASIVQCSSKQMSATVQWTCDLYYVLGGTQLAQILFLFLS